MNLVVIGAVICFLWGIAALSKETKNLSFSVKFAPVLLSFFAATTIWFHFATHVPVISSGSVLIQDVRPGELRGVIEITKARQCKFIDMNVMVVDTQGISSEARYELLDNPHPESIRMLGKSSLGPTIIVKQTPGKYSKMYLVTHHLCPYDNIVESKFGETTLPSIFSNYP